jgi:hypothetical protein
LWIGTGIASLADGIGDWGDNLVYGPVCLVFGLYLHWVARRDRQCERTARDAPR